MDLLITFMTSFPKRFISQPGFGPDSNFARFIGADAYQKYVQDRSEIQTHELLKAYREKLGPARVSACRRSDCDYEHKALDDLPHGLC